MQNLGQVDWFLIDTLWIKIPRMALFCTEVSTSCTSLFVHLACNDSLAKIIIHQVLHSRISISARNKAILTRSSQSLCLPSHEHLRRCDIYIVLWHVIITCLKMSHSVFVTSSICLHWLLVLPLFLGFLAYDTHVVAFNR